MAIDLYVGSLTRYYAQQWENVAQRGMRELGIKHEIVRPDGGGEPADPQEAAKAIVLWRNEVTKGLGSHLTSPLEWSESVECPYFTHRPAWDGSSGLILWAAHEEHPQEPLPETALRDPATHAAVRASSDPSATSRYSQVIRGTELWLPGRFSFTFNAEDVTGNPVTIGSAETLLSQLRELNARTWNAPAEQLVEWRNAGADVGAPIESSARFGFAVFHYLTQEAVSHQLPMKLDY